jgi:hypothetical protein
LFAALRAEPTTTRSTSNAGVVFGALAVIVIGLAPGVVWSLARG